MSRKLIIGLIAASGLWLAAIGIQHWFDDHEASQVAEAFMRAVQDGDRDAALRLLAPNQERIAQAIARKQDDGSWNPHPEYQLRVHKVERSGPSACVEIWVQRGRFVVKPRLHMQLSETHTWRITRIENPGVDPAWEYHENQKRRAEGELSRQADEALAQELSEAFSGDSSVSVERVPLDPNAK